MIKTTEAQTTKPYATTRNPHIWHQAGFVGTEGEAMKDEENQRGRD